MDNTSGSTQFRSESTPTEAAGGEGDVAAHHDDTGSYFQVVVEKHRCKRGKASAAVQTSSTVAAGARLPAASSPLQPLRPDGLYALPHPLLFACPCQCSACPHLKSNGEKIELERGLLKLNTVVGGNDRRCPRINNKNDTAQMLNNHDHHVVDSAMVHHNMKDKSWKMFGAMNRTGFCDDGPERVEVYYFERGCGAHLQTGGGAREAACERLAHGPARLANAALAEVLGVTALVVRAPLAVALRVQRCTLELARDAVGGCAHTLADYALKPALVLAYNAALHPVLVCAANVGRALREAVTPFALLVVDAVEPLVRLLTAFRLVEMHHHQAPTCPCVHAS